jgi:hypothetical protein
MLVRWKRGFDASKVIFHTDDALNIGYFDMINPNPHGIWIKRSILF